MTETMNRVEEMRSIPSHHAPNQRGELGSNPGSTDG
jgi:hypothetical protein